jgi:hypothetical protein
MQCRAWTNSEAAKFVAMIAIQAFHEMAIFLGLAGQNARSSLAALSY